MTSQDKIRLYGYNNITKNLSFSFYKLHYLHNELIQNQYNQYINETYSAESLNNVLHHICHIIGGNVLNVAMQNYQPQGASVTLMISEEAQSGSLVAHLDKSHLCVHTYPDDQPQNKLAIFRADIELSTCGVVSPLKALNYLIEEFNPDVVDIDYRVRGMTRDKSGNKHFTDHDINKISDFIDESTISSYQVENKKTSINNLFYSQLFRTKLELNNIRFNLNKSILSPQQQSAIILQAQSDIDEIINHTGNGV